MPGAAFTRRVNERLPIGTGGYHPAADTRGGGASADDGVGATYDPRPVST
ncbi:MAG TPA: hypothetical protein VFX04_01945 [Rhodanobacteraceae bacterium]|jgi:hypothetical protein|nr:hypothetical protein [Rhodanobacteraceae bacterium]